MLGIRFECESIAYVDSCLQIALVTWCLYLWWSFAWVCIVILNVFRFHLVLSLILPFSRYMLCDSVRSVFAHVRFFQSSDLVWAGEQSQLPPPSNPAYRARIPTLPSIWSSASLIYQRLYRDTTPRNNNILSISRVFAGYNFCWNSMAFRSLNEFLL